MTTSEEWADQIADLVGKGEVEEANELIKSLVDDGIIVNEPGNSPYITLDWRIDLKYIDQEPDEHWNENATCADAQELADLIFEKEGIPYGKVDNIVVNRGIMYIWTDEDGDGFPFSIGAYNHRAEIVVTSDLVKNLITPYPGLVTLSIGYVLTPTANEPELIFSDGYDIYIGAYDDLFEYNR